MRTRLALTLVLASTLACGSSPPRPVDAPIAVAPPVAAETPPPPPPPPVDNPPSAPLATDPSPLALADPPELLPPPAPAATTTGTPTVTGRDRRVRPPRARALLVVEIQGLERLQAATPKSAPDRPALARRLAEDYVELRRAAGSDANVAAAASRSAIKYYTLIAQDYPKEQTLDEVLYFRGLEYEHTGDNANARRSYYELIQKVPASHLVPSAYFAFGELFYLEATAGDPSKFDLARQAFREVVKFPPPQNAVAADAWLRLAQIDEQTGEKGKAREAYKRVLRQFPSSPAASQVPAWAQ